jgi:arsenate reductase
MTDPKVYNVLFLCTGNSARSILAECILNRLGAGRFKAFSAGSMPKGEVNPYAITLLKGLGYQTDSLRSKSWEEFSRDGNPDAPALDFVITVCDNAAGEVCPYWPGQPMSAHWGMPDPAAAQGSAAEVALAFADAYRMLNHRLGIFTSFPISTIDEMSLQTKLRDIGHTQEAKAPASE